MDIKLVVILQNHKVSWIFVVVAVLMMSSERTLKAGIGLHKVPAQIVNVSGIVNNAYSIVQTTIYNREGGQPIITRSQLDIIGPNRQSTKHLDVKLELPLPPVSIETYGATKVLDKVGQFVGAVGGPKGMVAGVGISGMAAIADYATGIAEQELTKLYENQQFRINLLEIIPTRYYTIDVRNNTVSPTVEFTKEYEEYQKQLTRYLTALKDYQDVNSIYVEWYKKLIAFDPSGRRQELWDPLRKYDADVVTKARATKNKEENEFSKMYPPYRIAIMASPAHPGNTCRSFGVGPWELHIIYYVGAQQTNQIAARYCVRTVKSPQTFIVELMQNAIQQIDSKTRQQRFVPGGIRIAATSNATFARSTGFQTGDFGADKTEVFNWFTSMVTNPAAGGIEQFMVPFDLHALREEVAEKLKATQDAKLQGVLDSMDKVIVRGAEAKQAVDEAKKKACEEAKEKGLSCEPEKGPSLMERLLGGGKSQEASSAEMPATTEASVTTETQSVAETTSTSIPEAPVSEQYETYIKHLNTLNEIKLSSATLEEIQKILTGLKPSISTTRKAATFLKQAEIDPNGKVLIDAARKLDSLMNELSNVVINSITSDQRKSMQKKLRDLQKDRLTIDSYNFTLQKSREAKNVFLSLMEFLESLVHVVVAPPKVTRTKQVPVVVTSVPITPASTVVAPSASPSSSTLTPAQTTPSAQPAPQEQAKSPPAASEKREVGSTKSSSSRRSLRQIAGSVAGKFKEWAKQTANTLRTAADTDIGKILATIVQLEALDALEKELKKTDQTTARAKVLKLQIKQRRAELEKTTGGTSTQE